MKAPNKLASNSFTVLPMKPVLNKAAKLKVKSSAKLAKEAILKFFEPRYLKEPKTVKPMNTKDILPNTTSNTGLRKSIMIEPESIPVTDKIMSKLTIKSKVIFKKNFMN